MFHMQGVGLTGDKLNHQTHHRVTIVHDCNDFVLHDRYSICSYCTLRAFIYRTDPACWLWWMKTSHKWLHYFCAQSLTLAAGSIVANVKPIAPVDIMLVGWHIYPLKRFLQRVSIACYVQQIGLSVRPSVRLSHACVVSKWLKLRSCGLQCMIAR